jgi:3-methyladenine DNA glycosylase AlkD
MIDATGILNGFLAKKTAENIKGMSRFVINIDSVLGISISNLRQVAK